MQDYIDEIARDASKNVPRAVLLEALKRGNKIEVNGVEIEVCVASFQHWKRIGWHCLKGWTWTYCEKRLPLPNTHRLYLRVVQQAK